MTLALDALYATVEEARAAGIGSAETYPDEVVEAALREAMEAIDRQTGQWFNLRRRAFRFRLPAVPTPILHFDVPPFRVEEVTVEGRVLDAATYHVYPAPEVYDAPEADRRNPRLELRSNPYGRGGLGLSALAPDYLVTVTGLFGFVDYFPAVPAEGEEEGEEARAEAPREIKRVAVYLAGLVVRTQLGGGSSSPVVGATGEPGPLKQEVTDKHSRTWAVEAAAAAPATGTGDVWADGILARYRRPIHLAACAGR